ncbi:hypothetical protein HOC01_00180 [archaeon]|jgi:membrane protein YqaA with SNARE-associated domain|nr:hypothetical protein [archaeon]MBT6698743.1 hypothetical protein [archaeon]
MPKKIFQKSKQRIRLIPLKKIFSPSNIAKLISLILVITIVSLFIGNQLLSNQLPTLTSFASLHFTGYLFFIMMPVEALVPYYYALGHSGTTLFILSVTTAIVAQLIDYGIGYLAPKSFVINLIGEKRIRRLDKFLENYATLFIFLFSITPLSSPIIIALAGIVGFSFTRTFTASLLGLIVKYAILLLTLRILI